MKKQLFLILISIAFIHSSTRVWAGYGMSTASFEEDPEGVDINYSGALNFGVESANANGGIMGIEYVTRGFIIEADFGFASLEQEAMLHYLGAYYLQSLSQSNVPGGTSLLLGGSIGYFMEAEQTTTASYGGDSYSYDETFDGDDWDEQGGEMVDVGVLVGAAYNINPQLSVRATYYYGLTEPNEDFITNFSTINVAAVYAIN